jgi:hypothetical protein
MKIIRHCRNLPRYGIPGVWGAGMAIALSFSVLLGTATRAAQIRPAAENGSRANSAASDAPATKTPAARRGRVGKPPDEPRQSINYVTSDQVQRIGTVTFAGINTPLRQALANLSQNLRLAILIDRRLDPDQVVDLDLTDVPLAAALEQIAERAGGGATLLGPVAYFGPRKTARQLRTLSALRTQEAKRLPAQAQGAALASRPLRWQSLTTPAELFGRLDEEAGIKIHGLDQIPHDLLAATELPAMPWVDRLTLVAAQFGLTFEFEKGGRAVKLLPIGEDVRLERSYPGGGNASTVADWKALAPDAEITTSGPRIIVRATVEDHERLNPSRLPRAPGAATGQQVYTLTMEGVPLDGFLAQLAEKVGLRIELDQAALAAAGIKPDRKLNVDVKNASLDELLRAALAPLGLESSRKDKTITVTVKAK